MYTKFEVMWSRDISISDIITLFRPIMVVHFQGLCSLSGGASYDQISRSLEAAWSDVEWSDHSENSQAPQQ